MVVLLILFAGAVLLRRWALAIPVILAADSSVEERIGRLVGKTFTVVFASIFGAAVLGAFSNPLGLYYLITGGLFVLATVLEVLAKGRWGIPRGWIYVLGVGIFVVIAAVADYDPDLRVTTTEYFESRHSSDAWQIPAKPVFLDEEPSYAGAHGLPRLDGATSLSGLMRAVAGTVGDDRNVDIDFYRTAEAYENLMHDRCDVVFAFNPSTEELAAAEAAGRSFILTPIGREGFVFFVNRENPVRNLTVEQLRGIYSGKIRSWRDLGGNNESIIAFQRRKNSGSQSRMERFMADAPLMKPPHGYMIWDMAGIVRYVASYHNYRYAIGYSFLYYVEAMIATSNIALLAVNGVYPSLDTVTTGEYPLIDDIYAVTTAHSGPGTRELVDWLRSPQGQRLVVTNGFAPVAATND
ncbi:MAG: substrate-binding domain-containing protein [Planctomycetes bacterium]|nr:substrate-binding domain-containing protein [Planctomycetota bacterium]